MKKKITKKFVILIVFFISFVGFFEFFGGRKSLPPKNQFSQGQLILQNDKIILEKNLNQEIIEDSLWSKINDYSIKTNEFVTIDNFAHLFKLSYESVKKLNICLKKNYCGMDKRNAADSYFDENKTPGHILLGRNLEILILTLRFDGDLSSKIDWKLIEDLAENSNEKIQGLAFELLNNFNKKEYKNADQSSLIIESFKGEAKADALVELSKNNSNEDHLSLKEMLEKTFEMNDPHTVISVVEKIKDMRLSKNELIKTAKSLCHFKEFGEDDPNWKMIKYNLKKININLELICSI